MDKVRQLRGGTHARFHDMERMEKIFRERRNTYQSRLNQKSSYRTDLLKDLNQESSFQIQPKPKQTPKKVYFTKQKSKTSLDPPPALKNDSPPQPVKKKPTPKKLPVIAVVEPFNKPSHESEIGEDGPAAAPEEDNYESDEFN